ncbi:MAG: VWA domain-containing protein [Flavobacteriia bacterium]|nr:VWA domain-containing protein [Flavobacteriia bacterium]
MLFFQLSWAQKTTRILFILDASNSMNLDWNNQTRMAAAKEVLTKSIESLRGVPNLELALRVYGHQSNVTNTFQDCQDTKLEVAFGPANIDPIKNKIKGLQAKGATPIARSLEAAAADFPDTLARNFIILITDGLESCDNDPCIVARKLRDKGVKVTPFVIGLGMDLSYLDKFECIGSYTDAESKAAFENVLSNILSKALLNTTVQINLNTVVGKPLETDVSMFLYEAGTPNLKYTFVHTLNRKGLPDTLVLDPSLKYDLRVATAPEVLKNNVPIVPHTHNIIQVPAGQGQLKITSVKSPEGTILPTRVLQNGASQTLNVQQLSVIQKYLVGTYQLEILTLPRTYREVQIEQSKLTSIDIPAAGQFVYQAPKGIVAQLFYERNPGQWEWVCDLNYNESKGNIKLQPGTFKVVYREKDQRSTTYTREKKFTITSLKITNLTL